MLVGLKKICNLAKQCPHATDCYHGTAHTEVPECASGLCNRFKVKKQEQYVRQRAECIEIALQALR